jgi:hypothetical protein
MPTITDVRARLRERRESRAARAALTRELASYDNPDDLNDLYAVLARYTDRETAEIRRILGAQQSR